MKRVPAEIANSDADATSLGLLRAWVCGLWLVQIACDPFERLAHLPAETAVPTGPFALLGGQGEAAIGLLLHEPTLWILKTLLLACLAVAATGLRGTRACLVGAAGLLWVQMSLVRSFGHVNHADLAAAFALLVLAGSRCRDGFAVEPTRKDEPARSAAYAGPFVVIAAALAMTYVMPAVRRLLYGGPEMFVGDEMTYFMARNSLQPHRLGGEWGFYLASMPFLRTPLNVGFAVVTLFELLAPLAVVRRRFRAVWLIVMVGFHVSTLLTMRIFFLEQLAMFVVFFDVRWRAEAVRRFLNIRRAGIVPGVCGRVGS